MPKFLVDVEWVMTAQVEVEAEGLDSAIDQATDGSLPKGEYMPGSFAVQEDVTRQRYEKNASSEACLPTKRQE